MLLSVLHEGVYMMINQRFLLPDYGLWISIRGYMKSIVISSI